MVKVGFYIVSAVQLIIFCLTNILFLLQSVHLERLALYHDSDRLPWEIDKRWEDISPREWIEVFLI
jgi:hypothetical protein